MIDRSAATTLLAIGMMATCSLRAQDSAPRSSEQKDLVAEWFALDSRNREDRSRQLEIIERLDLVFLEKDSAIKKWRKAIEKHWLRDGPRLERNGDNWYFEQRFFGDESAERGRYIVGGETKRPRGLLISMHGGGAGSGDAGGAHNAYSSAASRLGLVSISPEVLDKTEYGWTDSGSEEFVLDLVDAAIRTWKIDPNRVYFAGHSMGGYGSWTLGAHHADRVAGLAPSAGAPTPILERGSDRVLDVEEGIIPNLRNTRIAIFQSIDDPRVPPEPNQRAVELLGEAQERWGGYDFEYWEVDGRGHGLPPGGTVELLKKVVESERNVLPERITWQPTLSWKRQFYWLHWEQPVPNAILQIDRNGNTVSIESENELRGLELLIDERLFDLEQEIVIEVNGEETFRGHAQRTLGSLLKTSLHPDEHLQFTARVPVLGGDG
ncbi:MAG: hypothetical protein AAF196_10765 [Planctomycetota bacterium]